MALQRVGNEAEWTTFITNAGITDAAKVTAYAKSFVDNGLNETSLPQLDKATLVELGVDVIGHRMSLLTAKDNFNVGAASMDTPRATIAPTSAKATVNAKLPTLSPNMTRPQFRKFKIDWEVFKNIVTHAGLQCASHLYNTCDDDVQHSIINTHPDFLTYNEERAFEALEGIVTKRVNPAVHRMSFVSIQQQQQSVQDYIVGLRSAAVECAYECPECQADLSNYNIKDQFTRGLNDKTLQTEVLAKIETGQLKTLDELVTHAECYESAIRDQASLQSREPPPPPPAVAAVGHSDNNINNEEQVNRLSSGNNNQQRRRNQQQQQQQQQQQSRQPQQQQRWCRRL